MAAAVVKLIGRYIGGIPLLAFAVSVNVIFADQNDTFGVIRNPIELWAGEIAGAQKTVLTATYKFSSPEALEALVAARARGIAVSLLVDGKEAGKSEKQIKKARKAGIEVFIWPTDKIGEFHAKFTVIDERTLLMGSFNLSKAAGSHNTESFLITHDPVLIQNSTDAFKALVNQTERTP